MIQGALFVLNLPITYSVGLRGVSYRLKSFKKLRSWLIRDVDSFHASSKATLSSSSSATPAESKLLELRALSKIGVAGNMALQQ